MKCPSDGSVTVYNHIADQDDEAESVTITDTMTPSDVIAALVDAFGEAYVATLGESIRQRGKALK